MIRKKIRLIVTLVGCLMLNITLSACSLKHIEDTNGTDNYSLCSLTDEDLTKDNNSHLKMGSVTSQVNNTYTYRVSKLSGIEELEEIEPDDDLIEITVDFYVEAGNSKLVLVCQQKIVYEFIVNGTSSFTITGDEEYELKIAGESCKVNLQYTIEKLE